MKYVEYKERCSNCFALVEGDDGEWVCDECEKNCEDIMKCPEGLTSKKYTVQLRTVMTVNVEVDADDDCEACDKVDRYLDLDELCGKVFDTDTEHGLHDVEYSFSETEISFKEG